MTPTLNLLQRFATAHRNRPATLRALGLTLLQPPERGWCDDTPKNGLIFAHTGGDSVHFCLLERAGRITDESPVVMVVPCHPERPRLVLGDTLLDFLAVGSVVGYAALEQLIYDPDRTLGYLFDYKAFLLDSYFGREPPAQDLNDLAARKDLLAVLSKEFGLCPWADARAKLVALESKWSPAIEVARSER